MHPARHPALAALLFAALLGGAAALDVTMHTADVEPFSFAQRDASGGLTGERTGYDVDFMRELVDVLARETGEAVNLEIEVEPSIQAALDAVEAAGPSATTLALGMASITINADREEVNDFTPAYFSSGLRVMTEGSSDFNSVAGRVARNFFVALGLLLAAVLVIVSVVAPITFALESMYPGEGNVPLFWREEKPGSSKGYKMAWGLLRAVMWTGATVSGTATGYPSGMPGRGCHAGLKMLRVLLLVTSTAAFSAIFAVSASSNDINSYGDLGAGDTLCTVAGTTSASFAGDNARGFNLQLLDNVDVMVQSFFSGQCTALLYDEPVLEGAIASRRRSGLEADAVLVGTLFQPESYGIAVPHDSPWREAMRVSVLRVLGDQAFLDTLDKKYLNSDGNSADDDLTVPIAWILVPSLLGLGVTVIVILLLWLHYEDKEPMYRQLKLANYDRDYVNDYRDIRADEVDNNYYLYGVDFVSEVTLGLAQRAVRVLYERELRDTGVDLEAAEQKLRNDFFTFRGSSATGGASANGGGGMRSRRTPPVVDTTDVRVELPVMPDSPDREAAPVSRVHDV